MLVSVHTRISELIKSNPASIDAIASLAKPLQKLKNPLLRRIMASRVTIGEAANIGGCSLSDFKRVLEPLGFVFEQTADSDSAITRGQRRPQWLLRTGGGKREYFDVRGIIDAGGDPLKAILQKYNAMEPGYVLCIVNSFIPYPLINLLGKKGAQSFVETTDDQVFLTWFSKDGRNEGAEGTPMTGHVVMHDADSFDGILAQFEEAQLRRIDVRHLPMPLPMQAILETLPTLDNDEVLYVQHKRVPLHLLEALEDQPFKTHIHEVDEGDVRMVIVQNPDQKARNHGKHPNG